MAQNEPDKGGRTEELLRDYFLSAGYYAVRGVAVSYGDVEITDVDLWLYIRPSPMSRERVNVDAKHKSTPKALERILWARGLQVVLGLEACVVATTDNRPIVKEYGVKNNVLVLDGQFLARLAARRNGGASERLSEEETVALLGSPKDDKLVGNWRGRLRDARARLLTQLEFDGCNAWLDDFRYFAEQAVSSGRSEIAFRLSYLVASYFLVGLDFSLRTLAFEEPDIRRKAVTEGFRYGSRGRARIEETLFTASQMLLTFQPEAQAASRKLRGQVVEQLENIPIDSLGEFFSRTDIARDLFAFARAFEAKAYGRTFQSPVTFEPHMQAVLGVLLDSIGIDRRAYLK